MRGRLTRTRALAGAAVLILAGAALGLVLTAALGGGGDRPAGSGSLRDLPGQVGAGAEQRFTPQALEGKLGKGRNLVATARGRTVSVYRHAAPGRPARRLTARRAGARRLPLVFLVRARRGSWIRAYLPSRPNLSSGWLRARDVTLATTRYRVTVELRRHRLTAWRDGRPFLRAHIGTGRAVSPTPTGRYFVTDLLRPPDPHGFYGPYALGLSAHSPVYTSFEGGNGQVGIHGTDRPAALGQDVSHGCIRVRNAVITRLAKRLPLGTPVDVSRA